MSAAPEFKRFVRYAVPFAIVGLLLYIGLYAATEYLIATHTKRNPFYLVKTAPHAHYGYVILGASHAAAFDSDDMNTRLEAMVGAPVLNLAIVGGGVTVNRLLVDYFLAAHTTSTIAYVADSFAFYSRTWNEDRLQDRRLFDRAPFDPVLARLLLRRPASRRIGLGYLAGFSKINNHDRFEPETSDEERERFTRIHHPVPQIDQQRLEYLYPDGTDENRRDHYLGELADLISTAQAAGIRTIVIKPPIPERLRRQLPREDTFDRVLKELLDRHGVEFADGSQVGNDETFFSDSDHLNRAGVLNFFERYLKDALQPSARP